MSLYMAIRITTVGAGVGVVGEGVGDGGLVGDCKFKAFVIQRWHTVV